MLENTIRVAAVEYQRALVMSDEGLRENGHPRIASVAFMQVIVQEQGSLGSVAWNNCVYFGFLEFSRIRDEVFGMVLAVSELCK
jgi:hypothetical protein